MLIAVSGPVSVTVPVPTPVTVTPFGAATPPKSSVPKPAESVSVIGSGLLLPSTALETAPSFCRLALLNASRVPSSVLWAPGFIRLGYGVPVRTLLAPIDVT